MPLSNFRFISACPLNSPLSDSPLVTMALTVGLDLMLKDASKRKFDVIMAWAIDRLGAGH